MRAHLPPDARLVQLSALGGRFCGHPLSQCEGSREFLITLHTGSKLSEQRLGVCEEVVDLQELRAEGEN